MNEQKETVDGLVDAECGNEVQAGNAGLCRLVTSLKSVRVVPCFFWRKPLNKHSANTDRFTHFVSH